VSEPSRWALDLVRALPLDEDYQWPGDDVVAKLIDKARTMIPTLTEEQEAQRGALLAEVLKLRRDREHPDRWQTTWGTKTDLGLFRIVERILIDGE
jgi:hypothetical protein